jgi:hypothetical protein
MGTGNGQEDKQSHAARRERTDGGGATVSTCRPADMIGSRRVAWIEWRSGPPNPNPDQFLPIPTTCVGSPQDASRRPGAKIPGAESAGNASVVVAANPFRDER